MIRTETVLLLRVYVRVPGKGFQDVEKVQRLPRSWYLHRLQPERAAEARVPLCPASVLAALFFMLPICKLLRSEAESG